MESKTQHLYDHGHAFSEVLAKNLDALYNRVKVQNKAAAIIVDGHLGEGKTTLAVHMADYINKLDGKGPVDLSKKGCFQIGMGGAAFLRAIQEAYKQKYPVVIYDEGGDFNRRGALTQFNQMMNRVFETFRAFKVIVIICLPTARSLDSTMIDKGVPRLFLHCEHRTLQSGQFRGYALKSMSFMLKAMKDSATPHLMYSHFLPLFFGHFKNLEHSRAKQLDEIGTASKLLEVVRSELKMEGLTDLKKISQKVGLSYGETCRVVRKLNFKPARKIGRTFYYEENPLTEALWGYINNKPDARIGGRK